MTAARRLAAILAAEVVGYSRLMGADEAGQRRRCANRCQAQDVPDTLALRCLAKTHR
jgi:class 3 adenylate cyclase